MTTAHDLIVAHRAHARTALPQRPGFNLRDVVLPAPLDPQADAAALAALGLHVSEATGRDNAVYVCDVSRHGDLKVNFRGRSFCKLVIENSANMRGQIRFEGDGHLCVLCAGLGENTLNLTFRSRNAVFLYGRGGSARLLNVLAEGPDTAVYVGEDLMASASVQLRTSDSHGIFDMATGELINRPSSVVVGAHVWLGQEAIVMPGVSVGAGAVVGVRAVVTRDVPPLCAVAGVPARVVREGVSWTRIAQPNASAVEAQRQSELLRAELPDYLPARTAETIQS